MRAGLLLAAAGLAAADNSVCFKDLCDDKCILTNRKLAFPKTTNASHGMHSVVSGTLSKALKDPTYKVTASFMGQDVTVTPGTGSVCAPAKLDLSGLSTVIIDFTNGGKQKCPMAAGSTSVTPTDVTSSSDPPMGKFFTNIETRNGDGQMISTLQSQVGGCPKTPPSPPAANTFGKVVNNRALLPRDNSVCFKDLCDDKCILTNRKFHFPKTTNATHGMHSVVTGTLSKALKDPTYKVTASFMGQDVTVTPGTGSVCAPAKLDLSGLSTVIIDFTNGGKQKCPMAAGSTSVTPTDVTSSSDPPMGKFFTNIETKNGDGQMISTLQSQVGGCPKTPPSPPAANTFGCVNKKCVADPNGVSKAICAANCN